jgi:hypothetical protein
MKRLRGAKFDAGIGRHNADPDVAHDGELRCRRFRRVRLARCCNCTIGDEGRSPGAVYTPDVVIVPLDALPPATPFTLQVTLVLVALVTVAVKVCELPSRTEPLVGVTVTPIDEGGGGGGGAGDSGLPPPQPSSPAHAGRSSKTSSARMVS